MRLSRRNFTAALVSQAAVGSMSAEARSGGDRPDFQVLQARLAGAVLTPASAGYELSRRTNSFNPRTDRHPAAIACCKNADDVAQAVEFARRHRLELAVRSGGHDVLAASTCDGGLLIDLGSMNEIRRNETGGSVVVGPGARAGTILDALAAYGEVIPTGNNRDVGIGGLTLGGGIGPLAGSRGATCDNLLRARMITADGKLLTASEHENPDLFWALRGGGGNFGIVTELELATHAPGNVIGGMILFEGRRVADFFHFFSEYMARAPRELMAEAMVISPDRPVILVVLCFAGSAHAADKALAPLRAFDTMLADGVRAAPFLTATAPTPAIAALLEGNNKVAPVWNTTAAGFAWRGGSIRDPSDLAITAIAEGVASARGQGWMIGLNHHMHGAICDVGPEVSPLPRPRNTFAYLISTRWNDPSQAPANLAWMDATWSALGHHAVGVPDYVNYLSTDDPATVAHAYGETFARLRTLKKRYDPDNIFHRNRNIPPA